MEDIYKNIPPEEIPWDIESPPEVLMDLIDSGSIKPCNTIDLGCGTGNYSIYLSQKGFNVTGIDISPTAISIAKKRAIKKKAECNFQIADITKEFVKPDELFDFAFEWEVLHHIYPEKRNKYVRMVYNLLNPGAKYLSICFSDLSRHFETSGKYRKTPIGTILYFSSEDELTKLFSSFFIIDQLTTIEIKGKGLKHKVNFAYMHKK